jgi:hypothetical protein
MNLIATIDVLLQSVAAFLIFVGSYLGLIVWAILVFAIVELASERAAMGRAYGAKPIQVKSRFWFSTNRNRGEPEERFHDETAGWRS